VRVKVCGITSYGDAALVLDQGVDAIGFNFYAHSPRYIDPANARSIIRRIPPFVTTVGLFVNVASHSRVSEMGRSAGVQVLQLHGDESPEYCRALADWPLIKALRIGERPVEEDLEAYQVRAFLLDAKDDILFGGTGKSFEWSAVHQIERLRPIILAGGLRPDNVAAAIQIVHPYGVDVCSGVESRAGKKDAGKLIEFMKEVRNVSKSLDHNAS